MADPIGKVTDRNVVDSSLFRTVKSLDGKTTSFLIGHRCATLVPAAHQGKWKAFEGNIDDDEITATLEKDPPAPIKREMYHAANSTIQDGFAKSRDMAAVVLPEGATLTDNIMIFAEDLVIYRGSKFEWPGKNVTIFARRVIIAPRASETFTSDEDHSIIFDVSGPSAEDKYINQAKSAAGPGSKGDDGLTPDGGTEAKAGSNGSNGANGNDAKSGGTILFCAHLTTILNAQEENTVKVYWRSKGGNGGHGQKGGDGGAGGSGVTFHQQQVFAHVPERACADAKNGGNGGDGGQGGNGGDGGHVELCLLKKPSGTITGTTKFRDVENAFDVVAGKNGEPGDPGSKGIAGSRGYVQYTFHTSGVGMGPPHSYLHQGNSASDGQSGAKGATNSSPRTSGSSRTTCFDEDNIEAWALCINPGFLQMLVQRLLFEYDVLFGSYFDVQPIKGKSAQRLRFERSMQWLASIEDTIQKFEKSPELVDKPSEVGQKITDDRKAQESLLRGTFGGELWKSSVELVAARKIHRIGYDKLLSLGGSQLPPMPSTDSYNQSFRLIPNIAFSIKRLEQAAQDMETAEARRASLAAEIATADWTSSQTAHKIQELADYIASIGSTRNAAKTQVDSALQNLKKKQDALNKRIEQAKAELGSLKPSNPLNLSCENMTKIIEAAATCMMFTPAAAGKVLAGNIMSVGGSATSLVTTVHTAQGDVNKEKLMGEFHSVESKLGGKELTEEISKLSQSGEASKFMKVIMVAKSKFDALVDSHFPDNTSQEARYVWDLMMKQAEETHKALIAYQETLLRQAQVEAYFVQSQVAKNTLLGDTSATASIKSQLFYQIYDDSYAQQKAMVVKYYLDAIRAIVCITLEPTFLSHSLFALGCWDNVTGSIFNEVILPQIRAENDYLVSKDSRSNRKTTDYKGWITKERYPYIFGYSSGPPKTPNGPPTLTKNGSLKPFSFNIDSTNCQSVLNIDLSLECDIRMIECYVALEGAKLKDDKDKDPVISINTSFAGGFYVTRGDTETIIDDITGESRTRDVEFRFEIDEVITGCRYQYDSTDPKVITWRTQSSNPFARMIDLDDTQTERRAIQSPLTTWTIDWDEKAVDVSSVDRIFLQAKCDYRPRNKAVQDRSMNIQANTRGNSSKIAAKSMPGLLAIQLPSPTMQTSVTIAPPLGMPMGQLSSIHDYTKSEAGGALTEFPPLPISPFIDLVKWPEVGGLAINSIRVRVKNLRSFNRSSHTSRGVNSFMTWLVPTGPTQTRGIQTSVRSVFNALGDSSEMRINTRARDPNSNAATQGTTNLCQAIADEYDGLAEGERLTTAIGNWASNNDHWAVNASMSRISKDVTDKINGDYARYAETIFLSRVKSIGVGATALTPEHADAVRRIPNAFGKFEYCWLSKQKILEDEQAWLKDGKSLKGCVFQLGNSGLVNFDNSKVIEHGDMIIVEACAYTMSWHSLYGANSWITIFSKSDPTRVINVNYMEGQGKVLIAELVNCMVGEPLMLRAQHDFPVWLEAAVLGKSPLDLVKARGNDFQAGYINARKWFGIFDLGGIGMAAYRAMKGGNEAYDHYNSVDIEAQDEVDLLDKLKGKSPEDVVKDAVGKQTSKEKPGLYIAGSLVSPNAYILGRVPPDLAGPLTYGGPTEDQILLMRKKSEHALGLFFTIEKNCAALREALVKIAKETEAEYLAKDPSLAKLSPFQLVSMMRDDVSYHAKCQAAAQGDVIGPASFGQQIMAELQNDQAFKDVYISDLETTVSSVNDMEVQSRVFDTGGIADTYVLNELQSSTIGRLTSADVVNMIEDCKNKVDAESKALDVAKTKRAAIDPLKKEEVDEAQRNVDEIEKRIEDLKKTQESYEDVESERKDRSGMEKKKKDIEKSKEKKVAELVK